jgi:hypothetical protein
MANKTDFPQTSKATYIDTSIGQYTPAFKTTTTSELFSAIEQNSLDKFQRAVLLGEDINQRNSHW